MPTVIGKVLSTHGVRGNVKIRPLTDFPERYLDMESLSLFRDGRLVGTYPIEGLRPTPNDYFIVALSGVEDMDTAQSLCGCSVEVDDSERVELPPGEFWISDLTGLEAVSDTGAALGRVKDVVDSGASQLLVITDADGKDHYVPAEPQFLLNADMQAGKIFVHLIDGLWEL